MPTSYYQGLRFQIIDRELRKWPSITSKRLASTVSKELEREFDVRTIQKDLKLMKEDRKLGYNAPIEYDAAKKTYCYTDREYSISRFGLTTKQISSLKFFASSLALYHEYSVFDDCSMAIQKIVAGFDIRQKQTALAKPERIIFTDNASRVNGGEYIVALTEAILQRSCVSLHYQKFSDDTFTERILAPMVLKEYKNRWYVVGFLKGRQSPTTFGLDRIQRLAVSAEPFPEGASFDHDEYFKHCFGIFAGDEEPQEIILWFTPEEAPYIRSLPIHPSQQVVSDSEEGLQISININPSYEFYEYVLGKTPDVKVISPAVIAEKIAQSLGTGLGYYEKK